MEASYGKAYFGKPRGFRKLCLKSVAAATDMIRRELGKSFKNVTLKTFNAINGNSVVK